MGLFNLFKKKEKVSLQQLIANRKSNSNIYIGQIVSIEADEGRNSENYYLYNYPDDCISNKITKEYINLCEKYRYAIIKNFNDKKIDARVICCDGYLMRLKIELNKQFENGNAFVIRGNDLYDNNNIVGKIIDDRYDEKLDVILNELDNDKLVIFIRK